jgi:hypothetical protein
MQHALQFQEQSVLHLLDHHLRVFDLMAWNSVYNFFIYVLSILTLTLSRGQEPTAWRIMNDVAAAETASLENVNRTYDATTRPFFMTKYL